MNKHFPCLLIVFLSLLCFACNSNTGEKPEKDEHASHKGHDHEKDGHDHEEDGHDHEEDERDHEEELDLVDIEQKKCEHDILQIKCAECRSELGVIKLEREMAESLVKTEKATASTLVSKLNLVGEIQVNRLKTVVVSPIVSGRVTNIEKALGEKVEKGDLLAVLHSRDYGKAKLDYISAYRQYDISRKNMEWTSTIHKNLKKLIEKVKSADEDDDLLHSLQSLQIGKNKNRLMQAVVRDRLSRANYRRETKILEGTENLLRVLKQPDDIEKIKEQIAAYKIGEWKGKLVGAASHLNLARRNYKREKSLAKSGISTERESQEAKNEYQSALANYNATVESVSFWLQQREFEIKADLESSLAQYQSVIEEIQIDLKLHELEVEKEYQEAQNNLSNTEKQLSLLGLIREDLKKIIQGKDDRSFGRMEIRSPIAGTIIALSISNGQFMAESHPLYTISDLSKVWIWCDLYEHDLTAVRSRENDLKAIETKIAVASYPGEIFSGSVDYISSVMDENTRTVKLRIVVDNRKPKLKPGMFVEVELIIPCKEKAISVPDNSVFFDESQGFIFKRWKGELWVRRNVELGKHAGGRYEILKGIEIGDAIVTRGGFMFKSEVLKSKMGAG